MPRYDFRCVCGASFTGTFAMAEVPRETGCPSCSGQARRVLSAPHLGRTGTAAFGVIDRAERSAHEPEVVSGTLPGTRRSRGTPVTTNPLHQKLPRS